MGVITNRQEFRLDNHSLPDPSLLSPHQIPSSERLIIALDVPDVDVARNLVQQFGDTIEFYKLGLELFMTGNYFDFAKELKDLGKKILVDIKFFDVPETVARAASQLKNIEADFATVHGNDSILEAAVSEKNGTKILAVTVLTSLDENDLRELGFEVSVEELVKSRARRALNLGCDGVISSGMEAPILRKEHGDKIIIVTPGIRPVKNVDDQKRTVSLDEAFYKGADYVVVGRPITKYSSDPLADARRYQERIATIFGS